MSDTQQAAARRLWNRLGAILSSSQIETEKNSIAVLHDALTQAEQRGMERAAVVLDGYAEVCANTTVPYRKNTILVMAQAIRAAKESMASSACLDCGGSYAACMDWRSRGKLGCCPDCRHRTAKEAG